MDIQLQKNIIISMFDQAMTESQCTDVAIKNEIDDLKQKLASRQSMKDVFEATNLTIATLENSKKSKNLLTTLKKNGLYRMLYRHPKHQGQQLPPDSPLPTLLRGGFAGVAIAALIIVAFATTVLLGGPFWFTAIATGLFVGASAYLSGLLYGVVNDLFATRANLPYFLLGHQRHQTSLLLTNDKVAQGVAWGVAATVIPVAIFAVIFAVTGIITAFFEPMAIFLLPVLMVAIPLIAVGAEFYARSRSEQIAKSEYDFPTGSNSYQKQGLAIMSPTKQERAAWLANNDRNGFGYTKVPLIGLAALIGFITLSTVNGFLPRVLFSSPFAVIAPVAFAGFAVLALAVGGLYTYVNRERHLDDRNNLNFKSVDNIKDRPYKREINYYLYLDEDQAYVSKLQTVAYGNSGKPGIQKTTANSNTASMSLANK